MWTRAVWVGVAGGVVLGGGMAFEGAARAQVAGDPPPVFGSLKAVPVPSPAKLENYVRDKTAAIALGKALFWDIQAGSDGQACASCHFHAGADNRVTNQLDPGVLGKDTAFSSPLASGGLGGPNYTLTAADFPFHQLADPLDRNSLVVFDTNDVASSQGTFAGAFKAVSLVANADACGAPDLSIFHVGKLATRKVEGRNTPTVINAAFNFRNFWDGRANHVFNGVSPFGRRDVAARVLEVQSDGSIVPVVVALENSSLASQAVGPATSDFEMSCSGRGFADIGHKLIGRIPLANQTVSPTDSVLARYRRLFNKGLGVSYGQLIEQAFQPRYWSSKQTVVLKTGTFTLEEANFSLFWGLAIQMYESTLVSDDAPFDRYFDGDATALTEQELRGFDVFQNKGHCAACHVGPELSAAASVLQAENRENGLVERMRMGDGFVALYDNGFYNTGVRPTAEDVGVGGTDPFGNPLSFTREYLQYAGGIKYLDPFQVDPCTFAVDPCVEVTDPRARDAVDGAFKTPTLRNVELTGPYFHNGGQATLAQVVEFYNRGGDRRGEDGNDTTGFGVHPSNLDPDIEVLNLTDQEKSDLVAFLGRPLTDDRVRWEKAPFDHPELTVANGATGNEKLASDATGDGKADDALLTLPAVGAAGRLAPLQPFLR
jgi:cytochrome c peroxidase